MSKSDNILFIAVIATFIVNISFGQGRPCTDVPTIEYAGKTYNTVQIGTQCWLKENLDIGNMILVKQNPSNNTTIEKYCYENKTENCDKYGGLYQWNEAMAYNTTPGSKGICPDGFHIPTNAEIEALAKFPEINNKGNALKAIGQGTGSGVGTNTSDFSAFLAGYRNYNGTFLNIGTNTYIWSSPDSNTNLAYYMGLNFFDSNILMSNSLKDYGFSVRCVKD